jgi:valyl-tRNA synthetase
VKDPYGKRMSKTKGNVVDPLEAIDTAGADALRFALLVGTSPGNDQKFSAERLQDGRNFANKLWNATRFVLGARPASIAGGPDIVRQPPDSASLGPSERWLRSRVAAAVTAVDGAFADDNYGEVARLLYEAIWSELCDWGIELAKVRLADATLAEAERAATWWTLVEALDTLLRLLHPVMPFVTEALWATIPHAADDPGLLIVAGWPSTGARAVALARDVDAERGVGAVIELIRAVRNARIEAGVEAGFFAPLDLVAAPGIAPTVEAPSSRRSSGWPALARSGATNPARPWRPPRPGCRS